MITGIARAASAHKKTGFMNCIPAKIVSSTFTDRHYAILLIYCDSLANQTTLHNDENLLATRSTPSI